MRTRVVKRVLNVMMTAVLVLGILFFSSLSVKEYLPYARNRIQAERLQKEAAGRDEKGRRKINWKKLQKRNKDIIAWIEIPGTKVDYPIVKCPTRSYYLHHDAEGRNSILGAVFVQPETAGDFSDIHTVIYGHNMRDKQMFGSLHYFESKEFFEEHRDVYIYLPGETIRAVPYSVYDCRDATDTYRIEFGSGEEWQQWQEMTVEKSYHDAGENPEPGSQVVTLSTCSNGRGRKSRFVVNCIVRERSGIDAESVDLHGEACVRPGT